MKRLPVALATLTLIASLTARHIEAQGTGRHAGSSRVQTVFGLGPELHLLPNVGPVGTRVLVVGLGYRPGARVNILYGSPTAEFLPEPIATATASSNGRFHTTFIVSCAFVALNMRSALHPPRRCPLSPSAPFRAIILGGFVAHQFTHKRTATEGFIVTG